MIEGLSEEEPTEEVPVLEPIDAQETEAPTKEIPTAEEITSETPTEEIPIVEEVGNLSNESPFEVETFEDLTLVAGTRPAPKRERVSDNQDGFYLSEEHEFCAVFDGVSQGGRGVEAKDLAIQGIADFLDQKKPVGGEVQSAELMEEIIAAAQKAIEENREELSSPADPIATTFVGVKFFKENGRRKAIVGWVGDSRLYVKKANGAIEQITQDHGADSMIYSAIGLWPKRDHMTGKTYPELEAANKYVDIEVIEVEKEDILMLVTDGISDGLSDEAMFASPENLVAELAQKRKNDDATFIRIIVP